MQGKMQGLVVPLLLISFAVSGGTDSTTVRENKPWYIPDGISIGYAGGFGMVSTGILYNGKGKSELGITAGYVPHKYGNIWTTNILYSYNILPWRLNNYCELHLLKAGAFINLNYGDNIYVQWPEKYPRDYYWWNSSMRFGPFLETEFKIKPSKSSLSYTFFFQCLTNDFYLYTYFPNTRFIRLYDIIYLGAGIKIHAGPASAIYR
jgi:hypothetical protein